MASLGAKIDALHNLREAKRNLEEQVKAVSASIETAEEQLIDELDKQGLSKSTGKLATVSITSSIKPSVEDWDVFGAYILKHKMLHLLERRPSVTGCRELFEQKGKIPGVVAFNKRRLNVRTVNQE